MVGGEQERGCIAFFSTYRPPSPLHVYSSPMHPTSKHDEISLADGETHSYNYNGRAIPPSILKAILREGRLPGIVTTEADVDSGIASAIVFVSERTKGLETLHLALVIGGVDPFRPSVHVFNFAEVFGTFDGVRMEDTGCIAGDNYVYVSTKEAAQERRQPWTAVYKTDLGTGETRRLTPSGVADLSPSVSPSGKKIAVASFDRDNNQPNGWNGEIEDLKTSIFVMDVDDPSNRVKVIDNGGWPTWGSEDVIFFHRKDEVSNHWAVFRADISSGSGSVSPMTPAGIDAMTPAAINDTTVAVATIRKPSKFGDHDRVPDQYRHIEIFHLGGNDQSVHVTRKINPLIDHYNPFVMLDLMHGGWRIGYHRCHDIKKDDNFISQLEVVECPEADVGLFRATGVFPSFSKDGTKLAFVNNEFSKVFVYKMDSEDKGRVVYESKTEDGVFSPVWDQNPDKDTIYVCVGKSFTADATVNIWAIHGVSGQQPFRTVQLTRWYNNAFPSTNPEGTKLVFRSTRDWSHTNEKYIPKNLYIMEDTELGESEGKIRRLTCGAWTDTHCEWSPNGKWIVFASTQNKPKTAPESDNNLDPGYFAVYLVNPHDPDPCPAPVMVIRSGPDFVGHVNHPFFSPDGKSIVVVADLAAVSVEPISLPTFLHSVRPYGDIFIVDIDPDDIHKNEDLKSFKRITHSRFENSTASWANVTIKQMQEFWERLVFTFEEFAPHCPFLNHNGGHGFQLTGHLCVPDRRC